MKVLMHHQPGKKAVIFTNLLIFLMLLFPANNQGQTVTSGYVYHDTNKNNMFDTAEKGVQGVFVSNGSAIVETDANGFYELETSDNSVVFVLKPKGWTTRMTQNNIPQFFTTVSAEGAGGTEYDGLQPTGEWPESIDFALYPQEESDQFRVLVFGDTQPRTIEEVNYIAHDSVQEVIGVDAAFGTTLGDLVFDNLNLFEPLNHVIGQIGIPWRHVMGNHDIDFSADTNWDARGAYLRTYGPSWYAFTYGNTHFMVVDNIRWITEEDDRYYRTGLGEDQLVFIENFLERVPDDELVVFMTHIPWVDSTPWADENEKLELFRQMADHENTITFAAHTHRHYHRFIGQEDGFFGDEKHHMVSMATVCGSWWTGAHDEYGIPHSLMRDGTPTGYGYLDIDDNDWEFTFKAARRPAGFQMHVSAPDEIPVEELDQTEIFANVFNALPDAVVEVKIGHEGDWVPMSQTQEPDPVYAAMKEREDQLADVSWRRTGDANPTPHHLWKSNLPLNLEPGTYTIFVRATDDWHEYEGRRIVRIVE